MKSKLLPVFLNKNMLYCSISELYVQNLNMEKNTQDHFEILRKISKKPEVSQRELAEELGFSLGKLNYCIKELQNKGLIKIKNFRNNKKKINYLYALTPHGIAKKTKLAINFMKKKMQEYDELRSEINEEDITKIENKPQKKINQDLL